MSGTKGKSTVMKKATTSSARDEEVLESAPQPAVVDVVVPAIEVKGDKEAVTGLSDTIVQMVRKALDTALQEED